MNTILRTILILLVASIVAGGFFVAVDNSTLTSSLDEGGQPPAMTTTGGQPMERPEGMDHESGSIAQGLSGLLITLAKLTGITFVVLVLTKAFELLTSRKLKFAGR